MYVNYIHNLSCFFFRLDRTTGMQPSLVSLYMALFRMWSNLKFCDTMQICHTTLMRLSLISSRYIYYKSMYQLESMGVLTFHPENGEHGKACVAMKRLELIQSVLPAPAAPSFKNTGIVSRNKGDLPPEQLVQHVQVKNKTHTPLYNDVVDYFLTKGYHKREAKKFFNYYESINWQESGRFPVLDWKAAANKWVQKKRRGKYRKRRSQSDSEDTTDYTTPLD